MNDQQTWAVVVVLLALLASAVTLVVTGNRKALAEFFGMVCALCFFVWLFGGFR